MMSEIEDEVMVKPANTSTKYQSLHQECSQQRSRVPIHQESYSLHGIDSLPQDELSHLHALSTLVLDAPDINHARVEHLKREIKAGCYQIGSSQIAMRMLANS